jgi:hypothetical protein
MAVGSAIDHPVARKPGNPPVPTINNGKFFYFLWSLERVGVIYGLETIGSKDWYAWGAEILLASQQTSGLWHGEYGAYGADTCFALLFLKRANPARDLTATLKGTIQDPGEVVLRSGGVDGSSLKQQPRLTSPLEPQKANEGSASSTKVPSEKPLPLPDPKTKPATPPAAANPETEATRLATQLAQAQGRRQEEALAQLRDGKGVVYTQALAAAIPRLSGAVKDKARDALAERLARMSSATLADKLEDEDLEIRRAAALACAMKEDKAHLRKLIDLLDDPEQPVIRAAHAALKSLTGEDFGPTPDASRAERAKAVAAWKAWLSKQGRK